MKTISGLLLAASVTLNIALIALFIVGASSNRDMSVANPTVAVTAPVAVSAGPKIDPQIWHDLNTANPRTLVQQLRAAGFPANVIRAILSAQIQESFAEMRKALDPSADTRPFWKSMTPDPKIALALRGLSREQEKLLRELLGSDAESDDPMMRAYQTRGLSGVPPEKADAVAQLLRDYNDQRQDVFAGFIGGMLTPAESAKLRDLEKAQHADLAKILTPAELDGYDLCASNTASMLRYQLSAFNPTEDEFRKIFAIQRQFDDQLGPLYGPPSPDAMRARNEAQKQLNEQVKLALGPDRAADYERSNDYNYRTTSQLVTRLELPPETTNQVWAIQKDIQQRAQDAYKLSPDERTAQLAALADETKQKVTAALGERGYTAYQQYGGSWMQMLQPRARSGGNSAVRGDTIIYGR
jgi:hypothetical protein